MRLYYFLLCREVLKHALAIAENKIKQELRDIVGSDSNIANLVERASDQACLLEDLILQLAELFDKVADIIESQQGTHSDEQIQAIKNLLLRLPQLVFPIQKASKLPAESKLLEKLHYSSNHLADVLADTIEFRNIASEISRSRVNPANDSKKLERVRDIIDRGKKRAKERKDN